MVERICTKCGESKPATAEFYNRHRQRDPDGLRPDCRGCQRRAGAAYKAANRERINARAAVYRAGRREELARKQREHHHANRDAVLAQMRAADLKHEYGLSPEQYVALLVAQDGGCALCGKRPARKSLPVDHDHATGHIRGLLCHRCNSALGALGDSEVGLRRAIEYLRTADERVAAVLPEGPAFEPRSRRYA